MYSSVPTKMATYGFVTFVAVLFLLAQSTLALLPTVCVKNVTSVNQICCPLDPHNGMVCGGPKRGFCEKIYAAKEDVPNIFWRDDRMLWPTRFIKHACQCQPRYYGVACEQCWFGWTGPDCSIREKRKRQDIRNLNPHDLKIFLDIVKRSQTWPSGYSVLLESDNSKSDPIKDPHFIPASTQYYVTFLHAYGSRSTLFTDEKECEEFGILDFNHDGPAFPTWHRYFHLVWERMLSDIAKSVYNVHDFAMPYWDWVGMKECDICTNEYIGAPGKETKDGQLIDKSSIFRNLTDFCWEKKPGDMCYGCQKYGKFGKVTRKFISKEFPDQDDINFILKLKNFFVSGERDNPRCESFHMALEGFCGRPGADPTLLWIHNKVHTMIEGSMISTITATNDPIFILHHSLIDKLFSMWYRKYKPKYEECPNKHVRPGHKRDAFSIGIFPLARNGDMFTDISNLGYDYDYSDSVGNFAQNGLAPVFL